MVTFCGCAVMEGKMGEGSVGPNMLTEETAGRLFLDTTLNVLITACINVQQISSDATVHKTDG